MVASGEMGQPRLFVDLRAKASTEQKQQEQRADSRSPASGDAAAAPPPKTSADTGAEVPAPAVQVARSEPQQGKQADRQTHAAGNTEESTDSKVAAPGGPAAVEPVDPTYATLTYMEQLLDETIALTQAAQAAHQGGTWGEGDSDHAYVDALMDQAASLIGLVSEAATLYRARDT